MALVSIRFLMLLSGIVTIHADVECAKFTKAGPDPFLCGTALKFGWCNWTQGKCPSTCNPGWECKCYPAMCKVCGDNQGCEAQKAACELYVQMEGEWNSDECQGAVCMSGIRQQMLSVCVHGFTVGSAVSSPPQTAENRVSFSLNLTAPERKLGDSCVPDTSAYLKEHKGADIGAKMAHAAAVGALKVGMVIALSQSGLAGAATMNFVGSFIGIFFPGPGGIPQNPCSNVNSNDWGKCVWQQIEPFVKQYVTEEISKTIEDWWANTISGVESSLKSSYDTAYLDSNTQTCRQSKKCQDEVRNKLYESLATLNTADMNVYASQFFNSFRVMHGKSLSSKALYMSQYAALHISIMTALFGSEAYGTYGHRFDYQSRIICYTKKVFAAALEARNARLAKITSGFPVEGRCSDAFYSVCSQVTQNFEDKNCGWHIQCREQTFGRASNAATACAPQKAAYNAHLQNVQKQVDQMWVHWLAPLPVWLELAVTMQKKNLGYEPKPSLRPTKGVC